MTTENSPQSSSRRQMLKGTGIGLAVSALAGCAGGGLSQRELASLDKPLPADATATQRAFRRLMETLNEYQQAYIYKSPIPPTERDIAEGHRYLLHLINIGTELFVESEPNHPEMAPIVSPTRKLMGDNPDAYYHHASIQPNVNYRISGHNTGEIYLSLTVHRADEPGGWATGVVGTLNNQEFTTDANGNWSVLLGPNVSGPNTIKTTDDTVSVISRHYYLNEVSAAGDRSLHPDIIIEPLDDIPPPAAPDDESVAAKLLSLDQFIRANSIDRPLMGPSSTPKWFSLIPNTLGRPEVWTDADSNGGGWGAVDNAYAAGIFKLEPDQALIIKGKMPNCIFSNVVLWNKYLQSFDYRYRQISLNKKQMELGPDGSFSIVLARENPGVKNYLDTEGRESGIMYWRFMLPKGDIAPLETEVVPLAEVTSRL